MSKRVLLFLSFTLLFSTFLISNVAAPDLVQLEEHNPIAIDGNQELIDTASVEGWNGTGSEATPIIIKGLSIMGEEYSIKIANVDVHFRIEDCLINQTGPDLGWSFGILLENCSHGYVERCTIWGFQLGICLAESDCAIVNRTEVFESFFGVFVDHCSSVRLHSLDVVACGIGIRLNHTRYTTVTQTIVDHCTISGIEGICDSGTLLRHNAIIGSEVGVVFTLNENWVVEETAIMYCATGLQASQTSGGFVLRNLIKNCSKLGVQLEPPSTNVSVVENWFGPDNTQNAQDDGEANVWCEETLQIGNYWSDYSGEGPYTIPGGAESFDLYPTALEDAPDWEDVITIDDGQPSDDESSSTTIGNDILTPETLLIVSASTIVVLLVVTAMLRSRVSGGMG